MFLEKDIEVNMAKIAKVEYRYSVPFHLIRSMLRLCDDLRLSLLRFLYAYIISSLSYTYIWSILFSTRGDSRR